MLEHQTKEIENLYNEICALPSLYEARNVIEKFSNRTNTKKECVVKRLYYYSTKNNLPSWTNAIVKRCNKELGDMISKDPSNIAKCCRMYVDKYYPQMDKKSKEYKNLTHALREMWYSNGSKKHVCFFMHSKGGKTVINRKNNNTVNERFDTSWFSKLKAFVKKLF